MGARAGLSVGLASALLAGSALMGLAPAAGAATGSSINSQSFENLLYVANYGSSSSGSSVTGYVRGTSGDVTPMVNITGPSTGLNGPSSPAVDPSGHLWVANFYANTLTEYAPGASGNASPIRTIAGPATGLNGPDNVTLDPLGDIWVANAPMTSMSGTVTEYSRGANGDAAPIRTIAGPATGLMAPSDVALDPAGHIFVSNMMSLTEYAGDASGNAAPIATIEGPHTGLNGVAGLTIGPTGDLYAANFGYYPGYSWPGPSHGSVTAYARGANGDAAPIRDIEGDYPSNDQTGLSGGPCGAPALDPQGDLYVATVTTNTVRVFAPGATGNVKPVRTIAGPSTGIESPVGLTIG